MHLIGSMTEDQFRKELVASRSALIDGSAQSQLRSILRQHEVDLSKTLVVNWIPEQGEDIYDVLSGSEVIHLEIQRDGSSHTIHSVPLTEYLRRRHTRPQRIKLAVAMDLLEKGHAQ